MYFQEEVSILLSNLHDHSSYDKKIYIIKASTSSYKNLSQDFEDGESFLFLIKR